MMADAQDVSSAVEIGKRLKLVREALKMSQTALCRLASISPQAWNNAETGDNLLTVPNAVKLCRVTGVTMDWIYRGQITSALPAVMLEEIQRQQLLQQARSPTRRPRRESKKAG
jgi:transcriptional regulator with XRE-family HTH domain